MSRLGQEEPENEIPPWLKLLVLFLMVFPWALVKLIPAFTWLVTIKPSIVLAETLLKLTPVKQPMIWPFFTTIPRWLTTATQKVALLLPLIVNPFKSSVTLSAETRIAESALAFTVRFPDSL